MEEAEDITEAGARAGIPISQKEMARVEEATIDLQELTTERLYLQQQQQQMQPSFLPSMKWRKY